MKRPNGVFLNVPFDRQYEPLFIALIGGVVAFGRRPHCVLELPASAQRMKRLVELIESCPVSFHDLSRVQCSRTGVGMVPRFNMPFELGLAMAGAVRAPKRACFVLEERPFWLQVTTSDLNGFDPLIHQGRADGVLQRVLDALGTRDHRAPQLGALRVLVSELTREVRGLKRAHATDSLFSRTLFHETIEAATIIAQSLGVIR